MTEMPAGPLKSFCAWCKAENVETILQDGAVIEYHGVPQMSGGICPHHFEQEMARWQVIRNRVVGCPFCETTAPRPRFGFWGQPPGPPGRYAELLRCPECHKFFAPLGIIDLAS